MKVSELIEELRERLEVYGDWPVKLRLADEDDDMALHQLSQS